MVIKTPVLVRIVYGDTFFSPRSWAVTTPSMVRTVYGEAHYSNAIMGSKYSITWPFGHIISTPRPWEDMIPSLGHMATHSLFEIMGRQDSVNGPYYLWLHTLLSQDHEYSILRHWCVLFIATHSPPLRDHGQSRLRHRAVWSHIPLLEIMGSNVSVVGLLGHTFSFSEIMGSQDSVTGPYGHTFSFPDIISPQDSDTSRTVYGHTISFPDIMGSQCFVTGPYGHTFSFLDIMDSQDSVNSRTVYGHTISFFDIMGSQDSVTGPYSHTLSSPEEAIGPHVFLL
ncbi:hypothetical protein BgiMline_024415 [Biomphalaria glabrata]|nr:hypothetical protein BgiMline_007623 [Biomphalaria glabrata]